METNQTIMMHMIIPWALKVKQQLDTLMLEQTMQIWTQQIMTIEETLIYHYSNEVATQQPHGKRKHNEERHTTKLGRDSSHLSVVLNIRSYEPYQTSKHLFCLYLRSKPHIWIINSGATDHMCGLHIPLSNLIFLSTSIKVHIPNLGVTIVRCIDTYEINDNWILHNVL